MKPKPHIIRAYPEMSKVRLRMIIDIFPSIAIQMYRSSSQSYAMKSR